MTPSRFVWLAMSAFAALFGALAVLRHRAFGSGRFDLGNMTQAVWSTAHGDFLSVTDVHGEQISRLGSHFDPILALLAPLWWIWPSPELLLVVQAGAVAAGALPVFWLARAHLDSERTAAALALAYLLYPPVQWLDRERLPPGLARDPAAPLRLVVPRRTAAAAVRALRGRGARDEGARRADDRRDGDLVRDPLPGTANGSGDRGRGRVGRAPRDTRRRPALRPRRRLGIREPLRRAVARRPRPLVPRRAVPSPRPAPARGAARAAACPARARAEPALEHDHPDIREDALRSDGDPRPAGGDGLRRRPDRRPSRVRRRARGARRRDRARTRSAASTSTPGRTTRRRAGLSPSSPMARRSARRTRSARTSPTDGGSSASPSSERPTGSPSTRPGSPTSTASGPGAPVRRSRR